MAKDNDMAKRGLVERANIYAKAIAEPNRMKMLNISQPAVSKHLQILSWCGMLKRKKVGNTVYYSLDLDAVDDFRQVAANAFQMVWTPCDYGYNCDERPYADTCH